MKRNLVNAEFVELWIGWVRKITESSKFQILVVHGDDYNTDTFLQLHAGLLSLEYFISEDI